MQEVEVGMNDSRFGSIKYAAFWGNSRITVSSWVGFWTCGWAGHTTASEGRVRWKLNEKTLPSEHEIEMFKSDNL